MARKKMMNIPGFPRFQETIAELQACRTQHSLATYEVCTALSDGTLIVNGAHVDQWCNRNPNFKPETMQLIQEHNKEFNPHNKVLDVPIKNSEDVET